MIDLPLRTQKSYLETSVAAQHTVETNRTIILVTDVCTVAPVSWNMLSLLISQCAAPGDSIVVNCDATVIHPALVSEGKSTDCSILGTASSILTESIICLVIVPSTRPKLRLVWTFIQAPLVLLLGDPGLKIVLVNGIISRPELYKCLQDLLVWPNSV